MKRKVILTGGGSAGHVTPNLALIPQLKAEGVEIHYVGTKDGIEREIIERRGDVRYHAISSGKLRRYFSFKNLTDPFRVLRGIGQAKRLIKELKPDAVFSKGGYVTVPVVMAAKRRKVPVVTHESDYTPGLANRFAARYADRICVTFEDTLSHVGAKGVYTGTPIRPELYGGTAERGRTFLGFSGKKPILLVMGGSLGAQAINEAVRGAVLRLLARYDIVHICGKGKTLDNSELAGGTLTGYKQYEFISEEFKDVFAATDVVVSRAGANSVFEFLALAKPALLIPLPRSASRGDQILNAGYFARKGFSMVLDQEDLTSESLLEAVNKLYEGRGKFIDTMKADPLADGTDEVLEVIRQAMRGAEHR